ncbi:hypothetical protein VTN31DRAFT_4027 [Thermomyces dupontii]|uniref:uncharacterized protein n=1 Tax=Talaromyces thermophilus TaxID=28565 RepID=UPI003742444E
MESANVRPQKIYKIDKLYSAIPIPKYSGSIGIAGSSRTRGTVLKVSWEPRLFRKELQEPRPDVAIAVLLADSQPLSP